MQSFQRQGRQTAKEQNSLNAKAAKEINCGSAARCLLRALPAPCFQAKGGKTAPSPHLDARLDCRPPEIKVSGTFKYQGS
jgi:hypothetical protein